jgi:radical SAM protein with 4Fe4S-binding SPASM domain
MSDDSKKSPPLRMLFWESTAKCNLSCIHCRRTETICKNELSTAEAETLFDDVASMGKPVIVFSGGEPLLRPDWRDLAAYAASIGLPTALATNGTLISGPVARDIKKAGFRRVAVSIDGPDSPSHDNFRGQDGAFLKALVGLGELAKAGVERQINLTVAAHNADRLDEVYNIARRLDVKALHLFMLVPVGCGAEIAQTHQITAERYEKTLNWICDKQQLGEMELRATCAPHYFRVSMLRGVPAAGRGCLCGISVVFVSHTGEVFPCGYLPLKCGNIRKTPLSKIWQTSEHFAALRNYDRLTGKCGACAFKEYCGGCRARAFTINGDYLSQEPFCDF